MPTIKPEQLDVSIKSGKIQSLYLFDGPEEWLKQRYVESIISGLLTNDSKDFNLEKFDANHASIGQIVNSASSLPFLGERRVVLVSSADELTAADSKILAEAIESFPASTCLILMWNGKSNAREVIPAAVLSHGIVVTFWTPFANQLPSWVVNTVKSKGKTISMDAAAMVADHCQDLQQIANETEKLCLFIGAKKNIDIQDVHLHGLPSGEGDYKDLEDALFKRDLSEALRQSQLLADMGIRGESIFPLCERVFRTLYMAHYLGKVERKRWEDIFTTLNIRGKIQQENIQGALKKFSSDDLGQSLGLIAQADQDLKTGVLPSAMAVTLLLMRLCGKPTDQFSLRQCF